MAQVHEKWLVSFHIIFQPVQCVIRQLVCDVAFLVNVFTVHVELIHHTFRQHRSRNGVSRVIRSLSGKADPFIKSVTGHV